MLRATDAAGTGGGDISVCSVNAQTNALSGCTAYTTWSGTGARAPSGIVVKGGVAFIANDVASGGSNCPVLQCTNAAAMSSCSCVSSATTGILSNADGLAISPDGTKLYVTGTVSALGHSGISVCTLTGTIVSICASYQFSLLTPLTGLYANGTHVFTFTSGLTALTRKLLICDGTAPSQASCKDGVTTGSTLLAANTGPWGMSQFDGLYYVPDNTQFQKCSDVGSQSSCTSLTLLGLLSGLTASNAGINSIYIYPRI